MSKRKRWLPNKRQWWAIKAGWAISNPAAVEHTVRMAGRLKQEPYELWDEVMRIKYGLPPKPWEPADEQTNS
jgi:hypothetical protein